MQFRRTLDNCGESRTQKSDCRVPQNSVNTQAMEANACLGSDPKMCQTSRKRKASAPVSRPPTDRTHHPQAAPPPPPAHAREADGTRFGL